MPKKYSLGSRERLKSRKRIEQVFGQGSAVNNYPLRCLLHVTPSGSPSLQAGFTVSARNFRKAPDRNRIKRLMREAYRLQKPKLLDALTNHNIQVDLFLIYTGKELPEWTVVTGNMNRLADKLIKHINDRVAKNS